MSARSIGQKKQRNSPGFDKNKEFREWIASHGDVTGDIEAGGSRSYRRVTFDGENEAFKDAEEVSGLASPPIEEVLNNEWGVDGDDFPHPSTEHKERFTWHLDPSRQLIKLNDERYRESYDMDLLPFQVGSYASDEVEVDYLNTDLDGELIDGVKLEEPEGDEGDVSTTDDRPGQAHATDEIYKAGLATQPDSNVRGHVPEMRETPPQAAVDTSEDTRIVEITPDIEFEFGDEPVIEISRYY